MLPTISIGPLVIPSTGLVYILGAWIVLSAIERSAKSLGLNVEATYSLSAMALGAGLIGARLVFVALHWPAYRENLGGIIWPLTSGFDLSAGLIVGIAAGIYMGRARRLPPASTLDAIAPGLVVTLMAASLADFLSGPGYGTETDVFWAIDVFGIPRHPVQLYELLVGLGALLAWRRVMRRRLFPGQLFLLCLAIYSGGRLFVDAFRANAQLTGDGYHVLQLASLAILLVSVFLLGRGSARVAALASAD